MRLSYQVSTPEVARSWGVTAYQSDLERAFNKVAQIGYDGVELMVADPRLISVEEIKQLSDKYELPISMICTGEVFGQRNICFTSKSIKDRKEAIEAVKLSIAMASELACDFVNIGRVRGGLSQDGDHEEEKKLSLTGLEEVGRYAEDYGVDVLLEPVNSIASTFINSTEDGLKVIKEFGLSRLNLMLDTNHMYLEDNDIIGSLEAAFDYVKFIHLADSNRLYPGKANVDFDEFIHALYRLNYDSWLSVEVFQRPNQDVAIEKSYAFIKPILEKYDEQFNRA